MNKLARNFDLAANAVAIGLCVMQIAEVLDHAAREDLTTAREDLTAAHVELDDTRMRVYFLETLLEARGIVVDADADRTDLTGIAGEPKEQE